MIRPQSRPLLRRHGRRPVWRGRYLARFGIAALQLELAAGDNVELIEREVRGVRARFPWVEMVVVAELAALGPAVKLAQPLPGPLERRFCKLAREAGVWLVPGTLYERSGAHTYNTASAIDPAGRVVARYRKMYPFLPYERGVAAGAEGAVFDVPGVGRFGLSICYDMWFPETTRNLAWLGAEVVLHPSLTNTVDRDVEIAIARAGAASQQCYFIDVNCAGQLGLGRSCAFGPGGEPLHVAGSGREVIALELDLDHVRATRERGWHGLGQTLKSFRDAGLSLPAYDPAARGQGALQALGPLAVPAPPRKAARKR